MQVALEPEAPKTPYDPPSEHGSSTTRLLMIGLAAIFIALAAVIAAKLLVGLINLVTNLSFFHHFSLEDANPANAVMSFWIIPIPIIGGLIVGLIARYGSAAIRGHGIPEAMEQILTNGSRIPARITFLKPVSSAIAIGTGGPFGAEGPIIATGGALGSLLGQLLKTTGAERKILLAAGAAAGMTAIFGTPVSAVVLAVELLLFEFRSRSLVPIGLACAVAAGARTLVFPSGPIFAMPDLAEPSQSALVAYLAIGVMVGLLSVAITKLVYAVEDLFERLPIHWMWWPAIGGIAVGVVGMFVPATLGVGYENISALLGGKLVGIALILLTLAKLVSWLIALGSGTSGGTLAPLFTIGGGFGAMMGLGLHSAFPHLGIDPRLAAIVGMAAMFAGASRALLTSVIFAFEATLQPVGILPLLGGCTAAYLVSVVLMRNTIMTEKIARRGIVVPSDYEADFLSQRTVATAGLKEVVCIQNTATLDAVRKEISFYAPGMRPHHGYPVVDSDQRLVGVVTRREIFDGERSPDDLVSSLVTRPPVTVFEDLTLREAANLMVKCRVGRLPVVTRDAPERVIGILTRSDLLEAHFDRLTEEESAKRHIRLRGPLSILGRR